MVHGDEFDTVVRHAAWLAHAGDFAYRGAVWLNTLLNIARRRLGFGYWSLSAFLKSRVKNALKFIDNYEVALAGEARRRGLDGVICGHIHKAEMRDVEGILYVNDGDWVESCTALVEHVDGRLEILRWADHRSWSMIDHAARPTAVAANAAAEKSDTSGPRASPLAERRPGASLRSAVALARKLCADGVNTARNARLRAGTLAVRMWRLRIRFVVFGR